MDWVKLKMEHARQQRELLQGQNHTNTDQPQVSNPGGQASAHKKSFKPIWILGATTTWIVTMIAAWLVGSNVTTYDVSLDSPGNVGVSRTSEVAELKTHIATSMEMKEHLDDLNGRIQLLTDSIANVEVGLTRVLVMTDSMPGPASGKPLVALQQQPPPVTGEKSVIAMIEPAASAMPDTLAIANTAADKPANNIEKPEAGEKAAPGFGKQDSVNTGAGFPWVVNLASLNSETDANRFAARARSKDIQVEQHAVVIKGKEYWRVQASGFLTAAEARSQANTIKKKLGLKDVWVTKR